ncbi:branched-chain amino acid-binding protein [Frankia sp. B2]|uniref:ABC transporter substrate-binding protein n=1 Tax=unclassified Frankia TaxID=2632575 RepID=UPI0004610AB0|nr:MULTISPECIES: ABC transporter substrate-binding protein [unclassified Frankia]KDA44482.1 amino acid/amide ABC transporter substrate-binding protein, HAAT family [Frankia sp. BMG5.23]ORT55364.1 branched-chain amino acid-binding protein [Frankia sp. KB5]TFE33137.1 branched-chain amino acid-binding protein [Frankia sp. B2]
MTTPLTVALVTPLTGPDAAQGLAGLRGVTLWARDERLPLPWDEVSLTAYDAYPDSAAAMRAAVAAGPDALLGPYGHRAALAACASTDRVVFNTGAPSTRFVRQAFPNVVNIAAATSTWPRGVLAAVRAADRRARKVVLLASGDTAVEITSVTKAAAVAQSFEVASHVFPPGKAALAATRLPPGDILIVHAGPDDELAAANILLRRPWRAAAFSTAVSAQATASLGDLREQLLAPGSWMPESTQPTATGPTAREFTADFTALHGVAPTETAAWAYVTGLILGRAIRYCGGVQDASVLAAARGIDTTTLLGRFRLDEATGLQVGHQIPIVQWQAGASRTVWPRESARAPFAHPRLFTSRPGMASRTSPGTPTPTPTQPRTPPASRTLPTT